jgi:SNF2 family DNA or RNA helicase
MKEQYESFLRHSDAAYKEHQYNGVSWLIEREKHLDPIFFIKGGFLCDEMGVGKTIQLIATMILHFLPRTLIVVPPALIQQWKHEIKRFTGHTPLVYHGRIKKTCTLDELSKAPVVIVSYHALLTSKKLNSNPSLLFSLSWSRIIFDEAHHLRNKTDIMSASQRICKLSPIVWLVTGTPIQNSIKDLKNLCNVIGINTYLRGGDPREQITHILLKRTKQDADIILPPLTYHSLNIDWKDENEKKLSETVHNLLKYASRTEKLLYYTMSKQVCVLPALVENSKHLEDSEKQDPIVSSSKLDSVLASILANQNVTEGKGALVFCHFHKEMQWLLERLVEKGLTVAKIDGSVSIHQRSILLQSAYNVLLLQIQVGCEGLNLQEHYSDIYFVSPHWNPAVESQAVARCFRYGQTSQVRVFRFTMNTLQCMYSMDSYTTDVQKEKLSLYM